MKKVHFNLSITETKIFEKEKIDNYDDYLSTIQTYLCYGSNDDIDEEDESQKKEIILKNDKIKKIKVN